MTTMHPAEELALIRADLRALKAREKALRGWYFKRYFQSEKQDFPFHGPDHHVTVEVSERRVFDASRLPETILADDRFYKTSVVRSLHIERSDAGQTSSGQTGARNACVGAIGTGHQPQDAPQTPQIPEQKTGNVVSLRTRRPVTKPKFATNRPGPTYERAPACEDELRQIFGRNQRPTTPEQRGNGAVVHPFPKEVSDGDADFEVLEQF